MIVFGGQKESNRAIKIENMEKLNEKILDDSHPVYWDYLYVVDGVVIKSDIKGTVKDLKNDLRNNFNIRAEQVTDCDIIGRNKYGLW